MQLKTPKLHPKTTQKHLRAASGSKNFLGHCSGQKKLNFGGRVPPSCTAKGVQMRVQMTEKTTQNQKFIVYSKEHQFWLRFGAPKRRFWESKSNTFEHVWEQKHEREPIFDFWRMYCTVCLFLWSETIGFRCEKHSEGVECAQTLSPRAPKEVPEPSKTRPKTRF